MIIFPAIDIKEGKVVRLVQGKFNEVTEYGDDPVAVARKWEADGAKWLHIVDLDGAKTGIMKNFKAIAEIGRSLRIPIQVGVGVRDNDNIARLISSGITLVILGTKVLENEDFLKQIIKRWGEKIAVSVDCIDGKLTTKGWTEVSDIKATDFAKKLEAYGLRCMIYTDIAKDGIFHFFIHLPNELIGNSERKMVFSRFRKDDCEIGSCKVLKLVYVQEKISTLFFWSVDTAHCCSQYFWYDDESEKGRIFFPNFSF